ncbi:MAG TPA: shikimate dehydrogenase [Pyrinomonadaceae bacterium]|nr:shikimate dehydrogenase [Pyrinomonadaceae bacterium]
MDSSSKPLVCVSFCEPTINALQRALKKHEDCELIEVRLDCLAPGELSVAKPLTELVVKRKAKSILTLRPLGQGGREELTDETRLEFWSGAIYTDSFFDVELDLAERVSGNEESSLPLDWSSTICSYHDFERVPARVDEIYERLAATPAYVLKIAAQANDVTDCLPLFQLLERAHQNGRHLIAIAMGPAGVATRILGPSRGAFLTYAAPDDGQPTAAGQLSFSELNDLYRISQIDRQTQVFGLLGHPVSHSVSPHIHNAAFAASGLNAVYIPFEVNDVGAFLKRMVHPKTRELDLNIRGLSVTAPHKLAVMEHLDSIDPIAREIGAVNTIRVTDHILTGHNTDASGFIKPLMKTFGEVKGANCAVLGAGGAAAAALWSLQRAGATATLFARDPTKASELVRGARAKQMDLKDASFGEFDVVINATPLGSAGEFESDTPALASQLRGARWAYDLVYNPPETRFLREAREAGCNVLGGLSMLVSQAAEQFNLWTGTTAPEHVMLEAAERKLAE